MTVVSAGYGAMTAGLAYLVFLFMRTGDDSEVAALVPVFATITAVTAIVGTVSLIWAGARRHPWFWLIAALPALLILVQNAPHVAYDITRPTITESFLVTIVVLTGGLAIIFGAITAFFEVRRGHAVWTRTGRAGWVSMAVIGALVGGHHLTPCRLRRGRWGGRGRGATVSGVLTVENTAFVATSLEMDSGEVLGLFIVNKDPFPIPSTSTASTSTSSCSRTRPRQLLSNRPDPATWNSSAVSPAIDRPAWWGRSPSARSAQSRERGRTVSEVTIGREKMMGAIRYERSRHLQGGPAVVADPPCRGPVPGPGRRVRTQHTVRSRTPGPGGDLPTIIGIRALSGPFERHVGGTPSPPSAGRWSPHAPSTQLPACGYGRDDGGRALGARIYPFSLALGIGFALPALLLVVPIRVALIIATSRNSRGRRR